MRASPRADSPRRSRAEPRGILSIIHVAQGRSTGRERAHSTCSEHRQSSRPARPARRGVARSQSGHASANAARRGAGVCVQAHEQRCTDVRWHPHALAAGDDGGAADTAALAYATASADATAKLWNMEGACLATLDGHSNRLARAAFHPSGALRTVWTAARVCVYTVPHVLCVLCVLGIKTDVYVLCIRGARHQRIGVCCACCECCRHHGGSFQPCLLSSWRFIDSRELHHTLWEVRSPPSAPQHQSLLASPGRPPSRPGPVSMRVLAPWWCDKSCCKCKCECEIVVV